MHAQVAADDKASNQAHLDDEMKKHISFQVNSTAFFKSCIWRICLINENELCCLDNFLNDQMCTGRQQSPLVVYKSFVAISSHTPNMILLRQIIQILIFSVTQKNRYRALICYRKCRDYVYEYQSAM